MLDTSGDSQDIAAIEDGKLLDYISGKPLPDDPKGQVCQRITRTFFHKYSISTHDMEPDVKLKVDG